MRCTAVTCDEHAMTLGYDLRGKRVAGIVQLVERRIRNAPASAEKAMRYEGLA